MNSHWNHQSFLISVHAAVSKHDFHELAAVIAATPAPPNLEAALDSLTPEAWQKVVGAEVNRRKVIAWRRIIILVAGAFLALYFCFTLAGALVCRFRAEGCKQTLFGTYTPSPTLTPMPTFTPSATPTPTATLTPTLTPTPIPPSAFLLCDSDETTGQPACDPVIIYPRLPLGGEAAWVLNDQHAIVNPPLGGEAWTQSYSGDPGAAKEIFYYTQTEGAAVSWEMDVPLNAGLYQLYIVDTSVSSGSYGPQVYTVAFDGAPATPVRGQNSVIFNSVQGKQRTDDWLSIGTYEVTQGQRLSVQVVTPKLEKDIFFAVDRLLIVKVSDAQRRMLICPEGLPNCLPAGRVLASLLDDDRATFYSAADPTKPLRADYQGQPQTDAPAWNGSFHSLNITGESWKVNLIGNTLLVNWSPLGRQPVGKYELYIWIPETHATAKVSYALLVDGQPAAGEPVEVDQTTIGSQWLSLGQWQLDKEAAVGVQMTIAQQAAEIGVDAVAIVAVDLISPPTATATTLIPTSVPIATNTPIPPTNTSEPTAAAPIVPDTPILPTNTSEPTAVATGASP